MKPRGLTEKQQQALNKYYQSFNPVPQRTWEKVTALEEVIGAGQVMGIELADLPWVVQKEIGLRMREVVYLISRGLYRHSRKTLFM